MQNQESRASFLLSLDCELLWGIRDYGGLRKYPYLSNGFDTYYQSLLKSLNTYKVRASFAFVGAMALSYEEFAKISVHNLNSLYRRRHSEILQSTQANKELWFQPDIVKKVCNAKLQHEIASHSLTHLRFDAVSMDEDVAAFEMESSHSILHSLNKNVSSFIFPENCIKYLSQFKKSPYKIYRAKDETWYHKSSMRRALHFLDQSLPIAPKGVHLDKDGHGNLCIPGSTMFFPYDGVRSIIPDSVRFQKMKEGIDRAIREKKTFHLWFHPWNLGASERMRDVFDKTLHYVSEKREAGLLNIKTMSDFLEGKV